MSIACDGGLRTWLRGGALTGYRYLWGVIGISGMCRHNKRARLHPSGNCAERPCHDFAGWQSGLEEKMKWGCVGQREAGPCVSSRGRFWGLAEVFGLNDPRPGLRRKIKVTSVTWWSPTQQSDSSLGGGEDLVRARGEMVMRVSEYRVEKGLFGPGWTSCRPAVAIC